MFPDRRSRLLYAAIALLGATVLFLSFLLYREKAGEREKGAVLDTSRRFLVSLTTYKESSLAGQRKKVLALATGKFRKEYEETTGEEFNKVLTESKADSRGKVISIAVTSLDNDRATVFSIVEVSVINKDVPTPKVDRNLIELSLVHTSSGWRVDGVTLP